MSVYDDVHREALHRWLDERERDLFDDRAELRREAEREFLDEEIANEREDADRAERGPSDPEHRA